MIYEELQGDHYQIQIKHLGLLRQLVPKTEILPRTAIKNYFILFLTYMEKIKSINGVVSFKCVLFSTLQSL